MEQILYETDFAVVKRDRTGYILWECPNVAIYLGYTIGEAMRKLYEYGYDDIADQVWENYQNPQ